MELLLINLALRFLLWWNSEPSSTVTYFYDIKTGGLKVGTMAATRVKVGDLTVYSLTSESRMWIGQKLYVNHSLKSVYEKDKMIRAEVTIESSRGNYRSVVEWVKDHYEVNVHNFSCKKAGRIRKPIMYSVARLYFDEPVGRNEIFAENQGDFVKVLEADKHQFQVSIGPKPNEYYYSGGKMIKALMVNTMNYTLERRD